MQPNAAAGIVLQQLKSSVTLWGGDKRSHRRQGCYLTVHRLRTPRQIVTGWVGWAAGATGCPGAAGAAAAPKETFHFNDDPQQCLH